MKVSRPQRQPQCNGGCVLSKNPHSLPREDYHGARKRLFIGLITGTSVGLCLLLLVGWVVPYIGLGNIHPWVPHVTGALLVLCILCIAWASLGLVLHIYTGRPMLGTERIRGLTIKIFLPLMELLGRVMGVGREEVRHSFIKVNNELVRSRGGRYTPDELLILVPHCLQSSRCEIRLTYDMNHCKRCGKCPIRDLLALRDRYGVSLAIATGGTIARRIVVQTRPKLIIAVACERDLASGIQDTHPIPVYGVLNERPNGPCLDTLVPMQRLEAALRHFLRDVPVSAGGAPDESRPGRDAAAAFGKAQGPECRVTQGSSQRRGSDG